MTPASTDPPFIFPSIFWFCFSLVFFQLREYERSRLRYYYAIAECDCTRTAAAVYAECDGMEFERSSNRLDLRYVPPGVSFEGRAVREAAGEVPPGYEPPLFFTRSLQHTRVESTWDEDDPARRKALKKVKARPAFPLPPWHP